MKIWLWVKNNKLTTLLILAVAFFLFKDVFLTGFGARSKMVPTTYPEKSTSDSFVGNEIAGFNAPSSIISPKQVAPQPEVKERMVVEESTVSLVVDDVRQKNDQIIDYIDDKGGYMVSSSLDQPEEAPFGHLVVRVPSDQLRPTLEYLRGLAVKVSSEYLKGQDVTDQYVDLEARLATLNQIKVKFEEILSKSVNIQDILAVQREIINLQQQIDSLKGQQQYLEKTAENALLTIYLSTDEWALPYAPQGTSFRPNVIFKLAVRSLVQTLRGLAEKLIWIGVYSPIWLPVILVYWWWRRRKKRLPPVGPTKTA